MQRQEERGGLLPPWPQVSTVGLFSFYTRSLLSGLHCYQEESGGLLPPWPQVSLI
jgi:hypothetical protein